ncbi:hypothetical protein GWI33_000538 [Rhynchophorus ferrugineus]|uniref:Uncharacterized protein n=1 Tax=Rhynchophorus ferrugineus TaxID=354439 RepID=A0A834MM17_RHYFE|nr:hypothetical protein GWI33_000538 [Rhynchophorus ferrugineus]
MNRLWIWAVLVSCVVRNSSANDGKKGCPSPKAILPCRCILRAEEYQIWCTHSDLPSVLEGLRATAKFIQEPIDELILENNYLPSLSGRAFFPLKIVRLMLRHNGLERVSRDWLGGLETTLVELFVVEPRLRSVPEDSLLPMISLEAITIESELMKRAPLFSGLPKLRHLQIKSASLMELTPMNFKDNPSLEKLHIGPCPRLSRLEPNLIRDLPSLKLINISYSGLSFIHPMAITRLPILDELVLIGNRISEAGMVGQACRELSQLQILRLDENNIDVLEDGAFINLPLLKSLHLSNNRIKELQQGAFHRVPRLRNLNLNGNNLRRIQSGSFMPDSGNRVEELLLIGNKISHVADLRVLLDALPRLVFLDMSYNNLEAIPFGSLRGHQTLEHLNLDYNNIHLIDREAFVAMPALRELRLKNNSLSNTLVAPLWNLPQLKGLDLSGNIFRRLEHNFLSDLPSLRKLDLSRNELTFIDPASFGANPSLEFVNLSDNALANVHPSTFKHLINLYELDISRNALTEFVPGLPHGVEYLHLRNNKIVLLPLNVDLPALKILDLTKNRIEFVVKGTFSRLPQLRKLYLGENVLKKFNDGAFRGLSKLELLDLTGNGIINIGNNVFKDTNDLRDLNLGNNRLEILTPEIFQYTVHLKKLNLSQNFINEIVPGTLDKNIELQILDVSHNNLVKLSGAFVDAEILSSLPSLRILKLAHNSIPALKENTFHRLQHLISFDLEENELEVIESNSVKNLPVLKQIKLGRNKIKEIPKMVFVDLPSLQIVELQQNQIRSIAPNAFTAVQHLLMLNLSDNEISSMEDAGLKGVKSLEMLDLSRNQIKAVVSSTLEQMEWMVELRLDDNKICGVHGSPFNNMLRLRVLSLKNNQLMSFPERAIERIRSNIAILDINENPLVCACNMLWLQAWLHESALIGPKCADGLLLRELHIPREECSEEERNIEVVAAGCESELLSAPGLYGTSQLSEQWMNLKNLNKTESKNMPPSPEESEYFYDEYVDYLSNETSSNILDSSIKRNAVPIISSQETNNKAILNDKGIPKEVSHSPSSSGFTFFGLPLPNLGPLFGPNSKKTSLSVAPIKLNDRIGIVNKPQSISNFGRLEKLTPNLSPQLEAGFIPILPGSGGFKPMPNPFEYRQQLPTISQIQPSQPKPNKVTISTTSKNSIEKQQTHTEISSNIPTTVSSANIANSPATSPFAATSSSIHTESSVRPTTTIKNKSEPKMEIQIITSTESFEETTIDHTEDTTVLRMDTTTVIDVSPNKVSIIKSPLEFEKEYVKAIPQPAFLIPGGQQLIKKMATITKVHSPNTDSLREPLLSIQETQNITTELQSGIKGETPTSDMSWYFATYNNTKRETFKNQSTTVRGYNKIIILILSYFMLEKIYILL